MRIIRMRKTAGSLGIQYQAIKKKKLTCSTDDKDPVVFIK